MRREEHPNLSVQRCSGDSGFASSLSGRCSEFSPLSEPLAQAQGHLGGEAKASETVNVWDLFLDVNLESASCQSGHPDSRRRNMDKLQAPHRDT